jgi:hypothetical protein
MNQQLTKQLSIFDIAKRIDCSSIEDLEPVYGEYAIYKINHHGVLFELLTHFRENSPLLYILGQGSINDEKRKKYGLPLFQRWSWTTDLPCSVIILNDPTIYMGNLEVGWFQGTKDNYYLPIACELIQVFLNKINLNSKDVIFSGSSAGGFTSLMMAGSFPDSAVFVNNPQTDIRKYRKNSIEKLLNASFSGMSIEDAQDRQFDYRFSVIEYYRSISKIPNIYYVQNVKDTFHMNNHYMPFINEINKLIAEKHGKFKTSRFYTELYFDRETGHDPLPKKEFIRRLNRMKYLFAR